MAKPIFQRDTCRCGHTRAMHEFPARVKSGPCLSHETQKLACGCMSFELHRMAKRDDDPKDVFPNRGRWGRLLVVGLAPTYDMVVSQQLWWAREDLTGGDPVVFARAHIVEDDVNHGRLALKECTECWRTGVCQADDYTCIECRGVDMELLYESGRFGRRLQA